MRQEVAWLRGELSKAQDRVLAVANPQAITALQGSQPSAAAPPPPESFTVDGKTYVVVNGKPILQADYERVMAGQGFISHEGRFVSAEEHERAMTKLDEMVGCH